MSWSLPVGLTESCGSMGRLCDPNGCMWFELDGWNELVAALAAVPGNGGNIGLFCMFIDVADGLAPLCKNLESSSRRRKSGSK